MGRERVHLIEHVGAARKVAGRIHQATLGNLPGILRAGKPVAADFWANWCSPCHVMDPVLRGLSKEFEGRVVFAKVDVTNNRDLAEQFGITSIPTIVFFKNGKEWDRVSGVKTRQQLRKTLERLSR